MTRGARRPENGDCLREKGNAESKRERRRETEETDDKRKGETKEGS